MIKYFNTPKPSRQCTVDCTMYLVTQRDGVKTTSCRPRGADNDHSNDAAAPTATPTTLLPQHASRRTKRFRHAILILVAAPICLKRAPNSARAPRGVARRAGLLSLMIRLSLIANPIPNIVCYNG
ncbi:hypothetical protein J6590_044782 [Homalodisca vitripennis]|nr:hypothetical protein J6590_044782 [Homalodisca vitripennis]